MRHNVPYADPLVMPRVVEDALVGEDCRALEFGITRRTICPLRRVRSAV
jgi:hypothetical protein